jgi:hypothetical protein
MEQIAASTWRDAIEECVEQAIQDMTSAGIPSAETPEEQLLQPQTPIAGAAVEPLPDV